MLLKVFCRYTLIQVLQKAKATFSRKEKEQDGIFQSLIPPCEHQAFSERQKCWYSRAQLTEHPAVREVLALCVPWAPPPGSEILPKMGRMSPVRTAAAPNSSQVSAKRPSLEPLRGCTEITRTQKYHVVLTKGRWGREAENSACLWDPRLPQISSLPAWPSLTLASPQWSAVHKYPTHLRFWTYTQLKATQHTWGIERVIHVHSSHFRVAPSKDCYQKKNQWCLQRNKAIT